MSKKYNDNSLKIKDWTTKKLKQEAKSYHELIYGKNPCYGTKDVMNYDAIMEELSLRGTVSTTLLSF